MGAGTTFVYGLEEAGVEIDPAKRRALLGGKGMHLVALKARGLPVPPAIIITTEACKYYLRERQLPPGLMDEVAARLGKMGGTDESIELVGAPLISVRSGAPESMPGMLRTILNVGFAGRPEPTSGDARFALASWLRFLLAYADLVLDPPEAATLRQLHSSRDGPPIDRRSAGNLQQRLDYVESRLNLRSRRLELEAQVEECIKAVMRSWESSTARGFRRSHIRSLPDDTGTAVVIQRMVFGNFNERSGSGVAYTRDPNTGEPGLTGNFLVESQGEDVVGGEIELDPLDGLKDVAPDAYRQLEDSCELAEEIVESIGEIEFTVQDGELWLLQARRARLSGMATVRFACDRAATQGRLSPARRREALLWEELTPNKLLQAMAPRFKNPPKEAPLGTGVSPGAASGKVAYNAEQVDRLRDKGDNAIWVAEFTTTEQLDNIQKCVGVVTTTAGMSSHSIVVARGWGIPVVTGVKGEMDGGILVIRDQEQDSVTYFPYEEPISIDGGTGHLVLGPLEIDDPEPTAYVTEVLNWCRAELQGKGPALRVNADTGPQAEAGIRLGAEGVGLARFEGLLDAPGESDLFTSLVETVTKTRGLPGSTEDITEQYLYTALQGHLTQAYGELFAETIDANPPRKCAIRLVDELPPEHEPTLRRGLGLPNASRTAVRLRGAQIFVLARQLVELQVESLVDALNHMRDPKGAAGYLEVVVPFCMSAKEFRRVSVYVREAFLKIGAAPLVGPMLETPRSLLLAADYVNLPREERADFVSLGLNDLTELVMGLVQVEQVVKSYRNEGILTVDPIVGLDRAVAQLVGAAIDDLRSDAPGIPIHVASEQANDGVAVDKLINLGVDVLSSAPKVFNGLRLAAAKAVATQSENVHLGGDETGDGI